MPNLALVSLLAIVIAIVVGFYKKTNVGIIMVAFAFILSLAYGISTAKLFKGFSVSLFMAMLGVTYLFSILQSNKTLELLSRKIVGAVNHRNLLPVAMYVVGFALCAVGPGAIPVLAIIPVIAIPVAFQARINPVMLAVIGQCGVFGGRMTQITPEGVLVMELMEKQHITADLFPVWLCLFSTSIIMAILCYIWYRGWREDDLQIETTAVTETPKFTFIHWASLAGLLALILCAVVFSLNVGMTAFVIGALLSALGVGDENKAIKSIPWSVLILVSGVGLLMNIVMESGGIKLLSQTLTTFMNDSTAASVMVITSAIMSFFSSGLGVVFPTLIPACQGIVEQLGGNISAVELVAMVVVGGTVAGVSPISTAGALIMSGVATNKQAEQKYTASKMFIELFGWAFAAMILCFVMAIVDIYSLFC
ncbi:SLC13 family permease [Escherichia fergusonii]|uniref:Dicarboxylate carrier MatC N-terminal domain-containing protein n=2 Tax=Escherichia fergusonii TaxID=564 RepID=B7LU18_ESCF3|nr:SLC13 family permease [Escherichia fergusonii]EFF0770920.1 citrate transporter [Escherichia fergusonii]EFL4495961.1 citrate transporter [Escherichia fergusonii]EHG5996391.1 citrate transporter [Escherichia fergusonii]EHG6159484.1 citrate transporter [Escherichia fergusonii]EHG6166411.1 citrate transporter [Escherichia fergusonii]